MISQAHSARLALASAALLIAACQHAERQLPNLSTADAPGEYYVVGHAAHIGVFDLPLARNRRTIKSAVIAAQPHASVTHAKVTRVHVDGPDTTVRIHILNLLNDFIPDQALEPNDLITLSNEPPTSSWPASPVPAPNSDEPGECYVIGNVLRTGVFQLRGGHQQITLKRLLVAAGNPSGFVTIYRQHPNKKGEQIGLEVRKLLDGQASDYFLQPDDLIMVESNRLIVPFHPASSLDDSPKPSR
jgi:hypothetical protein